VKREQQTNSTAHQLIGLLSIVSLCSSLMFLMVIMKRDAEIELLLINRAAHIDTIVDLEMRVRSLTRQVRATKVGTCGV